MKREDHELESFSESRAGRHLWLQCKCGLVFSNQTRLGEPVVDLRQAHDDHVRAEGIRRGIELSATAAPAPVSPLKEARREHAAAVEAHIRARQEVARLREAAMAADIALSEASRLTGRTWDALAALIAEGAS